MKIQIEKEPADREPLKGDALPADFRPILTIDVLGDSRTLLLVNGLETALFVLLVLAGFLAVADNPVHPVLSLAYWPYFGWMMAVLAACALCVFSHLYLHGLLLEHYGGGRPSFGFCHMYVYTWCPEPLEKKNYLKAILAPVILCGIALLILSLILPPIWLTAAYIVQIANLCCSGRDFYVAIKLFSLRQKALIHDQGLKLTAYGPGSEYPL